MGVFHKMKGLGFALSILIVQVLLVASASGRTRTAECHDEHDLLSGVPDQVKTGLQKCMKSVGAKAITDMTPEKLPCFSKCVMEMSGLVDETGHVHKENILKDVEQVGIEDREVLESHKKALERCFDNYGQNLDPAEPTCKSYSQLALCTAKAAMELFSDSLSF